MDRQTTNAMTRNQLPPESGSKINVGSTREYSGEKWQLHISWNWMYMRLWSIQINYKAHTAEISYCEIGNAPVRLLVSGILIRATTAEDRNSICTINLSTTRYSCMHYMLFLIYWVLWLLEVALSVNHQRAVRGSSSSPPQADTSYRLIRMKLDKSLDSIKIMNQSKRGSFFR